MYGICTLANDRVYDQLIALLNSIEAIYGQQMPVCVYPYDDNTTEIAAEIARRPQVQLYDDRDSIQQWDEFVRQAWDSHPTAQAYWLKIGSDKYHRVGTHRRYCAFDNPFDYFVYMDADTLLMSPLDQVFHQLNHHDFVVYDFQYKDLSHVYSNSPKLTKIFTQEQISKDIFCSGFYAAKKGLFNREYRKILLEKLRQGEAEVLYSMAPDQTLLNYMVMRLGISYYNFAHELPTSEKTGCCVTSDHFTVVDNIVYDKSKRLTYLHYIGLSSSLFKKVCVGENINFPYRDVFLHYRYLHESEAKPKFTDTPKQFNAAPSLGKRIFRKLGLTD